MAVSRKRIVDAEAPGHYHLISRTVRGAFLCGGAYDHRKQWLEDRLDFLTTLFAVDDLAHDVLDTHLHLGVSYQPRLHVTWTPEEVARRWLTLRLTTRAWTASDEDELVVLEPTAEAVEDLLAKPALIRTYRERLGSLSWFMKELKEPVSRRANREEDRTGHFWEGRFKSIRLLDEEGLLVALTYIDLNSVRAGIAELPEEGPHNTARRRAAHVRNLAADDETPTPGLGRLPVNERAYLTLLDRTGRQRRSGQSGIPREAAAILERLGLRPSLWRRLAAAATRTLPLRGSFSGTHATRRAFGLATSRTRAVPDALALPKTG